MVYAIDALSDALDATRAFLWPFDAGRWLRLALITFFVFGSIGGFPPGGSFQVGDGDVQVGPVGGDRAPDGWVVGDWSGPFASADPGGVTLGDFEAALWFVLAIVAIGLVLGLLYLFVGSIMEFVFYEALRSERVSVREYAGDHLGLGVSLFAFRVVLGLLAVVLVGGAIALVFFSALSGPVTVVAALLILAPLFFLLGILGYLVNLFTTEFVAPIMLLEDRGVLSGWRRFWGVLRGDWGEFLIYALIRFGLNLAAGLVLGILVGFVAVLLAIPFGGIGVLLWIGLGDPTTIGTGVLVVIGLLALLYALVVAIAAALVAVPVITYLRYFALLVLGDADETVDLIPDRRAGIRSGGTGSTAD
ncbi:MAG: hypothetical protein ACI9YT_003138 [Halobacteriales archaeon]|jgi:hypothetical protein